MQLIVFVILSVVIPFAYTCSCIPMEMIERHPYCDVVWASGFQVVNKEIVKTKMFDFEMERIMYSVKHLEVFKKPDNVTCLPWKVYTNIDSAACGVDLKIGQEAILSGSVINPDNSLSIYLCGALSKGDEDYDLVKNWKTNTTALRDYFDHIQC